MNASLPESVRKALETVTLDDNLQPQVATQICSGRRSRTWRIWRRACSPRRCVMNASLPESVRKALETVTLDDNLQRGLQHKNAAGGAAARGVFGVEPVRQGGV